jgi:class 3 adenylate cyclase/tetratricopeptide (TPR) repeat protein
MRCPQCQHENRAQAKFCEECATPLARACSNCGTTLSGTEKFCFACAAPVVAASWPGPVAYTPKELAQRILTSKAALEGERKQVTVLFADLKDSMELLADRDPEEARRILDPVLERMMEAVHRYEGTVNQVMGDGIMALFGAPLAHEDHAVRACYAALRMQASVTRYGEDIRRASGVPIQIRVGLNSGEVVVRSIGSDLHMDYTAVGQTTHLAARLEQMAIAGSVLMSAETLRLAEGYVQVKPLGPVPVRGVAEPVDVYQATGRGAARTRLQAAATSRGLTRFVGRNVEMDFLRRALVLACEAHGQVVGVMGEGGVGKSRLFHEFVHSERTQGWLILEGVSVSHGKLIPYLPVTDLLRRYFTIEPRDDPLEIKEKVTTKLLTRERGVGSSLAPILALVDAPIDDARWTALDPPQRRRWTLDAVKDLLVRESQAQPLLIVLEDLHWVDSETQALLDSLVETLPGARMLLLVNYRPEYQHGWGNKISYMQLRIDPLPPATAEELLDALVGTDAALTPLRRILVDRTDGNPFFLEESVRSLVETKALVGVRGAYHLATPPEAKPLAGVRLAATVQAVLAARIDRLPSEEKTLLQTAAVVGKDVPFDLLQAIAEVPEATLRRSLAHLQATEFVHQASMFPHLVYTFRHTLTHEVAYSSLLQAQRRVLHARIVDATEELYRDRLSEHLDSLARHAIRGEMWGKALLYCRMAAAKAFARSAHRAAVACLEEALAALKHLPRTQETIAQGIDVRLDLRYSLIPLGEFQRIFGYLEEAENLATESHDERRLGLVSGFLSSYFYLEGNLERALEYGRRAAAIGEALQDFSIQGIANAYSSQVYYALGNYPRAIAFARRNIVSLQGDLIHERFGMALLPSVYSRSVLVSALAELGEFTEASAYGEEGIRIAEAVDHPYSLVFACLGAGRLFLRKGDVSNAVAILERAVTVYRTAQMPVLLSLLAAPLGAAYAGEGRLAEALELLKPAREHTGFAFSNCLILFSLSQVYLQTNRTDDALRLAHRIFKLSLELQARGQQGWALWLLGETLCQRNPPDNAKAEECYRKGLTLAEELGMRPLQAHCHLGLGVLYSRMDSHGQAHSDLLTAAQMFRAMNMISWLRLTEDRLIKGGGGERRRGFV